MEMKNLIKRIKGLDPEFQEYASKLESEINRGISTLCILSIINEYGEQGVHGYQVSKDLEQETNDMLVIEEGTLYPILRKLEDDGIIKSYREEGGRRRKYYELTNYGKKVFNYLAGFYSKLTEAIASLFDVKVNLNQERYLFCPMCSNKIDITNREQRFCDACGFNIENELQTRGMRDE
jgi:PadR family transcriptional regulator PadR